MKSKEIMNILTRKHDCDHVSKWFKNSKKCKLESKNHKIGQYLIISYVEVVVKIWVNFEYFIMYDAYNRNICEEVLKS
jgi:hypothetical protein